MNPGNLSLVCSILNIYANYFSVNFTTQNPMIAIAVGISHAAAIGKGTAASLHVF